MQAADLHKLKDTLTKSNSLHFNALGHPNGIKMHFSTPGEEYYTVLKRDAGIVIEYHTPTHFYTLNNCFDAATIELHNQFRTIMASNGITIPVCTAHEEHNMSDGTWIYNAWLKPISDAKTPFDMLVTTSQDSTAVFNNVATHMVATLNVLATQPLGSKVWPSGWSSQLGLSDYFVNPNNEWYWKPPMEYVNRYQSEDVNEIAKNMFTWLFEINNVINMNPHIHRTADFHKVHISQLNSDVFDVNGLMD